MSSWPFLTERNQAVECMICRQFIPWGYTESPGEVLYRHQQKAHPDGDRFPVQTFYLRGRQTADNEARLRNLVPEGKNESYLKPTTTSLKEDKNRLQQKVDKLKKVKVSQTQVNMELKRREAELMQAIKPQRQENEDMKKDIEKLLARINHVVKTLQAPKKEENVSTKKNLKPPDSKLKLSPIKLLDWGNCLMDAVKTWQNDDTMAKEKTLSEAEKLRISIEKLADEKRDLEQTVNMLQEDEKALTKIIQELEKEKNDLAAAKNDLQTRKSNLEKLLTKQQLEEGYFKEVTNRYEKNASAFTKTAIVSQRREEGVNYVRVFGDRSNQDEILQLRPPEMLSDEHRQRAQAMVSDRRSVVTGRNLNARNAKLFKSRESVEDLLVRVDRELYHGAYVGAFEELKRIPLMEKLIREKLFLIFVREYELVQLVAKNQMHRISKALRPFRGDLGDSVDFIAQVLAIMPRDMRADVSNSDTKNSWTMSAEDERRARFLQQEMETECLELLVDREVQHWVSSSNDLDGDQSELFISSCIEISWRMIALDPPLRLIANDLIGQSYEETKHSKIGGEGPVVSQVVWPGFMRCVRGGESEILRMPLVVVDHVSSSTNQ